MATENKALITLFGATGDLAKRKLYTSLFKLYQKGYLADHFALLGTSRHEMSDEEFQEMVLNSLRIFLQRMAKQKNFLSISSTVLMMLLNQNITLS